MNGDRSRAEERGRFAVELKVLGAFVPGPCVPHQRGFQSVGMQDVLSPWLEAHQTVVLSAPLFTALQKYYMLSLDTS